MKSPRTFFLVGFLALWTLLPYVSSKPPKNKLGVCPPNIYRCTLNSRKDVCDNDYDCFGVLKCCDLYCSRVCRFPLGKPGYCPAVKEHCLMINRPNKCDHDIQCEGKKKCCEGTCGRTCVSPVKTLQ